MSFWIGRRAGVALFFLAAAAFASLGCGGGRGNVSGEVKYSGQPLAAGDITFIFEDGEKQQVHADVIDGKYTLPPTQTGKAKVTITATAPNTAHGPLPAGATVTGPSVSPEKYVPIPQKYSNLDQSGLTYDVKGGDQKKNFDLTP
ncbi:MAG TPA: hypothetical protein DDY78_28355 [Planctomycetales bacterium]|nr:hypothetical protein [Planctomycetales bacterium]